jgi:phage terminase small subunit
MSQKTDDIPDNLTPKQKKFCHEYMIDLNATQAAIRAGYSPKTAYAIGEQNLKKLEIKSYLESQSQKHQKKTQITAEVILNRLDELARTAERPADQIKANELLGKHLQLFTDKIDVKHSGDIQLNIVRFSRSSHND